jgi:hypothetical protein
MEKYEGFSQASATASVTANASASGLLNNLVKLYDDKEKTNPEVNITMSKYPVLKYI